jgi:hypothetical protein
MLMRPQVLRFGGSGDDPLDLLQDGARVGLDDGR